MLITTDLLQNWMLIAASLVVVVLLGAAAFVAYSVYYDIPLLPERMMRR